MRHARVRRSRAARCPSCSTPTAAGWSRPGTSRRWPRRSRRRAALARGGAREHAVTRVLARAHGRRLPRALRAARPGRRVIGYYVHHQGDGHVTRAAAIARALRTSRSPGSARGRGRTTGRASGCSSPATTTRWTRSRPDRRRGAALGAARPRRAARADGADRRLGGDARAAAGRRRRLGRGDACWCALMGVPVVVMALPGVRDDAAAPARLPARRRDPRAVAGVGRRARRRSALARRRRTRSARSRASTGAPAHAEPGAPARAGPLRPRRHGADARRRSRPRRRRRRGWRWTVLGPPGTRWVPTRGRCSAAPTSSSPTRARTRSPTSPRRGGRPWSSRSRGRTTSSCATADALDAAGLAVVCPRWPGRARGRRCSDAPPRRGGAGLGALEPRPAPRNAPRRCCAELRVRTAVITIVARPPRAPRAPARRARPGASHHVVVAMGEGEAERCSRDCGGADVIGVPSVPLGLPLAARPQRRRAARARGRRGPARLPRRRLHPGPGAARALPSRRRARRRAAVRAGRLPAAAPPAVPAPARDRRAHPAAGPARGRRALRRRPHAVLDAVLRGHARDVAARRRVLRGLRRLRRRGHRLRAARPPRRASASAGSAAPGPTTSTIRPESPPVQPPRRHPAQRRALSPPLGLVADGGLARAPSPSADWPVTTGPRNAGRAGAEPSGGDQLRAPVATSWAWSWALALSSSACCWELDVGRGTDGRRRAHASGPSQRHPTGRRRRYLPTPPPPLPPAERKPLRGSVGRPSSGARRVPIAPVSNPCGACSAASRPAAPSTSGSSSDPEAPRNAP